MKLGYEIIENVGAMLSRTPKLTYSYVRQEMNRWVKRFQKRMWKERMSGPPGIAANKLKKNLKVWTRGTDIRTLQVGAKIGKILKIHEFGATITPKKGEWLYIHGPAKAGIAGNKEIVAKVRKVQIPARLGFRSKWNEMVPDARVRIQKAMNNALKVASEKNAKQILKII